MALPDYKSIVDLVKKGATLEAQELVMELREAALELREQNHALREENADLKREIQQLQAAVQAKGEEDWKGWPDELSEGELKAIRHLAEVKEARESQLQRIVGGSQIEAQYAIDRLVSNKLIEHYISMYGEETKYWLDTYGRKYLVEKGLL